MRNISIKALAIACHAAIWFVVIATVAAERVTVVKDFLAGLTGHHWTAKGVFALILFVLVSLLFAKTEDPQDVTGLIKGVIASALLGGLAILTFYTAHYYGLA